MTTAIQGRGGFIVAVASIFAAAALSISGAPAEAAHKPYRNEGRTVTPSFPDPGPQCSLLPCTPEPTKPPTTGFPGPVHPCFQEPCPPAGLRAETRR